MAVEIGPIISFLSQRIILAPPEVEAPKPIPTGVTLRRFREGLLTEAIFRAELASQGRLPVEIDRLLTQALLERAFDDFQDRLNALEEAFNKEVLTFEEFKYQVLQLIPDQAKALLVVDLAELKKRPKPKPITPEEPPTLTVGRLLAAFKAGVLPEPQLRSELTQRDYSPEDIDIMIATETARLPKPKAPALRLISLGDLKAMLALGVLSPEEFRAELIERKYSPEDADALLGLELIKAQARAVT